MFFIIGVSNWFIQIHVEFPVFTFSCKRMTNLAWLVCVKSGQCYLVSLLKWLSLVWTGWWNWSVWGYWSCASTVFVMEWVMHSFLFCIGVFPLWKSVVAYGRSTELANNYNPTEKLSNHSRPVTMPLFSFPNHHYPFINKIIHW